MTQLSRLLRMQADGDWLGDKEAGGTVYEQIDEAWLAADRQRERIDDARDQEQAAIDSNPDWERDFDADRRERASVLRPLTPEAIAAGEAELKRLMEAKP